MDLFTQLNCTKNVLWHPSIVPCFFQPFSCSFTGEYSWAGEERPVILVSTIVQGELLHRCPQPQGRPHSCLEAVLHTKCGLPTQHGQVRSLSFFSSAWTSQDVISKRNYSNSTKVMKGDQEHKNSQQWKCPM